MLAAWAEQVPDGFRFALKASQRITHQKRLKDAGDCGGLLLPGGEHARRPAGADPLSASAQFPQGSPPLPGFPHDLLPAGCRAAFEFRHASWFDEESSRSCESATLALCVAEDEKLATPLLATTDWGYLRLRRQDYAEEDLRRWAAQVAVQPWAEAYVFFKHEEEGKGPLLADALAEFRDFRRLKAFSVTLIGL